MYITRININQYLYLYNNSPHIVQLLDLHIEIVRNSNEVYKSTYSSVCINTYIYCGFCEIVIIIIEIYTRIQK